MTRQPHRYLNFCQSPLTVGKSIVGSQSNYAALPVGSELSKVTHT